MIIEHPDEIPLVGEDSENCIPEKLLASYALVDEKDWPPALKNHLQLCDVCLGVMELVGETVTSEENLNQFLERVRVEAESAYKPSFTGARALWAYVAMPEMRFGVAVAVLISILFIGIWQVGSREEAVSTGDVKESTPVALSFMPDEWQLLRDLWTKSNRGQRLTPEEVVKVTEYEQMIRETPPGKLNGSKTAEVNQMLVAIKASFPQEVIVPAFSKPLQNSDNYLPPDAMVMAQLYESIGACQRALENYKKENIQVTESTQQKFTYEVISIIGTDNYEVRRNTIQNGMKLVDVVNKEPGEIVIDLNFSSQTLKNYAWAFDTGLDVFKTLSKDKIYYKTSTGKRELDSVVAAYKWLRSAEKATATPSSADPLR